MSLPWLKPKLERLGYSVALTTLQFQSQGHMHGSGVSKCNPDVDDNKTLKYGTVITVKITVKNSDVKLIDKYKIQRLLIGFSLGCPLMAAENKKKSKP